MRQLSQQSNPNTLLLSSLIGITISSAVLLFLHRRRRRRQQHTRTDYDGDGDGSGDDDETIQALKPAFDKACEMIKSPKISQSLSLSQNDQLMLYGLYKQAQSGNAASSVTPPPSKLHLVAYAKYDAWTKFHDMPRDFAMMKYVEVVNHFCHHRSSSRPATVESLGGVSYATGRPESAMTATSLLFDDNDDIIYDDDDDDTDDFLSSSDDDDDDDDDDNDDNEDAGSNSNSIAMKASSDDDDDDSDDNDDNGDAGSNSNSISNERRTKENRKLKSISVSKEEHSSLSSASTFSLSARQSTLISHSTEQSHSDSNIVSYDTSTGAGKRTATSTFTKATLLHASSTGDKESIQQCIDNGVDVNGRDESGQTALHLTADKGYIDCVNLLLSNGADPNAADESGISVLETAVFGGCVKVVEALLEAGSDPDQEDMDGETPRSCAEGDGCEEMQLLLRNAAGIQKHQ
eukprot:CAMPEP_0203712736 /NCGR_PEP_ID=MMETSP0091-20130426/70193_1 /ASSEMBLY_ACC=CAM_ASM_001089 /TAXON_ID=426623 /ORGANISM="Chaetoceros affinis, Strain CCMP159" /LENGTH=461 /DNA_ID=CAMNT_0050590725 /DNA_START=36 /DNA_END=1422 /DNA_ORIENTATION=+